MKNIKVIMALSMLMLSGCAAAPLVFDGVGTAVEMSDDTDGKQVAKDIAAGLLKTGVDLLIIMR